MCIKLGQCFLVEISKIKKIISFINLKSNDLVLEIGSGYGVITKFILQITKVFFIEIEPSLFHYVNENAYFFKKKKSINDNIINVFFEKIFLINKRKKFRIFSNLPYYLAKKILMFLLENKRYIQDINIMLQKEVANQLICNKSCKISKLTIILKYWFNIKPCFELKPIWFFPVPKVFSIFLILDPWNILPNYIKYYNNFLQIIKIYFLHKKKFKYYINKYFLFNPINQNFLKNLKSKNLSILNLYKLSNILIPKDGFEPSTHGASIQRSTN